jgi:dimethylaniline monooxygenase (N-oxide forming)
VGQAEYSDIRMARPPEDDIYYEFFKAKHTTQYLEDYVDRHNFAGQSLRQRIRFCFTVRTIRKLDGVWVVSGEDKSEGSSTFHARKIIIASGLTSEPNMPDLPGKEHFESPVLHQETFGQSSILSFPTIQNVTVLGGGKAAADMVYAAVKAEKSVSWIIRGSGTGPGFLLSPKGKGPYKNAYEIGSTRVASTMSPSIFNPDNWWTRFLHGTHQGRKIVKSIWDGADKETREVADFVGRPGALKGFENLEPPTQ